MQVQVMFFPNTAIALDHKCIYSCRFYIWNFSISNSTIWFGLVYKAERNLNNLSGTRITMHLVSQHDFCSTFQLHLFKTSKIIVVSGGECYFFFLSSNTSSSNQTESKFKEQSQLLVALMLILMVIKICSIYLPLYFKECFVYSDTTGYHVKFEKLASWGH